MMIYVSFKLFYWSAVVGVDCLVNIPTQGEQAKGGFGRQMLPIVIVRRGLFPPLWLMCQYWFRHYSDLPKINPPLQGIACLFIRYLLSLPAVDLISRWRFTI